MLTIRSEKGFLALENRTNLSITTEYEGEQSLSFDMKITDPYFTYMKEEGQLRFDDNDFLIKTINQRSVLATITASLNMDEWKERLHQKFSYNDVLFSNLMNFFIPEGWKIEGSGSVTGHCDFELSGVSDYEILMECKKQYEFVLEYHTASKTLKIIQPQLIQPRGLYMSDELNLQNLEFKGSSTGITTRLYAYGKKTEIKDEEGNVIRESYVTFASINDGKEYIDDHTYSEKIISAYWQEDKITDERQLLDEAIERLKQMAMPQRSYSCKLVDLSRVNPKYRMLDFKMYDKPILIDQKSHIYVTHQIVQYKFFPDNQNLNEITLSTTFQNITGTIENMKQSISGIEVKNKNNETMTNEIIRDVAENTARIQNTYSKGETETIITSTVQQSVEEITQSIQKIEENDATQDVRLENAETVIQPDNIKNIVSSDYYKKDETDNLYTTKEQLTSAIIQTKDEVNTILTEMSGFNFILNSCGWSGTDFWYGEIDESGNHKPVNSEVFGVKNNDTSDNTISGHAFQLKKGIMHQDIRLTPGSMYTCSIKIKKSMTKSHIKLIQNNQELVIFESNELYTDENWNEHVLTFECTSSLITIEISSSNDYLMISDLMMNDGTIKKTWSPNNDEIYTTGVKIDRSGIRVHQSETDTDTVIDSTEFAVEYQGKKVIRVNRDTTELENAKIRGLAQFGKLNIVNASDGRIDFFLMDE